LTASLRLLKRVPCSLAFFARARSAAETVLLLLLLLLLDFGVLLNEEPDFDLELLLGGLDLDLDLLL